MALYSHKNTSDQSNSRLFCGQQQQRPPTPTSFLFDDCGGRAPMIQMNGAISKASTAGGILYDVRTRMGLAYENTSEKCIDGFSAVSHRLRRPLLCLCGLAVLVTVRGARKSLSKTATSLPVDVPTSVSRYMNTPDGYGSGTYGSGTSTTGLLRGTTSSAATSGSSLLSGYGNGVRSAASTSSLSSSTGSSSSLLGTGSSYGTTSSYGAGTTAGTTTSSYGSSSLSSASSSSPSSQQASFSTAALCDAHCNDPNAGVSVLESPSPFRDYSSGTTGTTSPPSFAGEVVVVQSYDSTEALSQLIRQAAGTPQQSAGPTAGNKRVLVVDSGASPRAAAFDADLVRQVLGYGGFSGVIVNGCIRHTDSIRSSGGVNGMGVKALCAHPRSGPFGVGMGGGGGGEVQIGGVAIRSGNWIYADGDGILVSQRQLPGVTTSSYGATGSGGGGGSLSSSGYESGGSLLRDYGGGSTVGASRSYGYNNGGTTTDGGGSGATPGYGSTGTAATSTYGTGITSTLGTTTSSSPIYSGVTSVPLPSSSTSTKKAKKSLLGLLKWNSSK